MRPPLLVYTPEPQNNLLSNLARDWEMTVVIDDSAPKATGLPSDVRWMRRADAAEISLGMPRLYHLANRLPYGYIFDEARCYPGVTVLHDYVLHQLVEDMTLTRGEGAGYELYLACDHGERGVRMARQRMYSLQGERGRFFSAEQPFLMPLNGPIIDTSRGLVVHSQASLERVRLRRPRLPVTVIPRPHTPATELSGSRRAARQLLGLSRDKMILCTVGPITARRHVSLVLDALAQVRDRMPRFEYWLLGEECEATEALRQRAESQGLHHHFLHTAPADEAQLCQFLEAADLVIDLDYPSVGETSDTLIRTLGLGRCALVFDYDAYNDFPASTVLRAPLDTADPRSLANVILKAARNPQLRERTGQLAQHYIEADHSAQRCAILLTTFLRRVYEQTSVALDGAHSMEVRRCKAALELVPRPQDGGRALALGGEAVAAALRHHFGYAEVANLQHLVSLNLQSDTYPYPDGHFDFVIACPVMDVLTDDPMFLICEVSRVLKSGGLLALVFRNATSLRKISDMLAGQEPAATAAEYSPSQAGVVVQCGGFTLERLHTTYYWDEPWQPALQRLKAHGYSTQLRGDDIFMLARKTGAVTDRRPAAIYGA